ncbi:MAG: peptidoglycan DD-metalloendopeptidase family protein [Candidatus Kerfeldbacteria bacterium]|nr:peptidoglycan DD-metalloendopeptidase family protein [Candidatus Kerfeldbacteria bacterium]
MDTPLKKPFLKRFWWIAIVIFLIGVGGVFVWKMDKGTSGPPELTANFIDTSKVEKISKFRSCQGHVVVPQDESERLRNMKHYLMLKPEYKGKQVEVYAPFDGEIMSIFSNPSQGLEGEMWLGQKGSDWNASFEHLVPLDTLSEGDKVKAGELIGHVATNGIDLVYATAGAGTKIIDGYESPFGALDSIFNHMSDEAFNQYISDNIKTRSDLSYTKEYRDANPCKLETANGAQAAQLNDHDHPEDWIIIN